MIDEVRARVAAALVGAAAAVTGEQIEPPPVQDPPRPEMGDLASPVCMQLAKRLGRPPRPLAEEFVAWLLAHPVPGVRGWEIAGPGFLNVLLDRPAFLRNLLEHAREPRQQPSGAKVLVEHTSINPNKAAHIGHLRNSCLGDTLARLHRWLGSPVEVHNYIDDTGVQVADVVIGFLDVRGLAPAEVEELPEPFDYLCWDLYTEVSERMGQDEALQSRRRDVLMALEEGRGIEAEMGRLVARRIVTRHLLTMRRLDIEYDVLVREGDILALDLWSEAFERLRKSDRVFHPADGKHAGCWMMSLAGTEGFADLAEADKVLVRSNGTATYVAKDIAYHFWKYGLLQRDFRYQPVPGAPPRGDGKLPWQTTHEGGEQAAFGHAGKAITVIDVRQSYLQSIVAEAFELIGESESADSLTHFAYEMVALSPKTARALGIPVEDDAQDRQFVEMSGRRGYGVKADDLLDELERRATEEVGRRDPELAVDERRLLGRQIAIGASRYFLLRFARNTVIVFDLDEALAFEGETGPYVQYAAVRAARIFERLREQAGVDADRVVADMLRQRSALVPAVIDEAAVGAALRADAGDLWNLILALGRLQEVAEQAARSLELSLLAKYAFTLAQHFNRFYHSYPILQAEDPADRALRILVADAFRRQLAAAVDLLGIPVPRQM